MTPYELADRAESMVRHYYDAPKGAHALAWRAMRLLDRTRELAGRTAVGGLVRGHGIPDSPVSRFACTIVEEVGRLPAHGQTKVGQSLQAASHMAFRVASILRRRQVLATAPAKRIEVLVKRGWFALERSDDEGNPFEQKPA